MSRSFEGIWIPADLWFRKDLTLNEKVVYLEVKSLDNDFGCVATNKKLAEVVQLMPSTISGFLKTLESKGMIRIDYANYQTFEGRVIRIVNDYSTPSEKSIPPSEKSGGASEKSIHSNTISNTISIDNKLSNGGLPSANTPEVIVDISKRCRLFIEKFNSIRRINNKNSKFVANNSLCATLKQRLKIYTPDQIITVITNCINDDFHISKKLKYVTPEYVLRLKTIEMFKDGINAETADEERPMIY